MANNLEHYNRRMLIKRTSVSSEVPTIPTGTTGAVDVLDHTKGGWLVTDIYEGEMMINTSDSKAWIRYNTGIIELDSVSGHSAFIELPDTPSSYSGQSGMTLQVNNSENGIEFVSTANISTIVGLSDTPSTITNDKVLVGSGGSYIEEDYITSFSQLDDISGLTGHALDLYRINLGENGLEPFTGSDYYVDLTSIQTITGTKTFTKVTIDDSIKCLDRFYLGTTDYVTEFITDTGLTFALDTNVPTTLAVKTYIDNQVITAVGGSYVDLSSLQSVAGIKTFTDKTIHSAELSTTNILTTKDIFTNIASYHYFGDGSTDGSYRTFINPSGFLETQKRESGVWVFKSQI